MERKKVMISQPMNGLTDEEIKATRDCAAKFLEGKGYEVVNTLFFDPWYSDVSMKMRGVVHAPVCLLSGSLDAMSKCDTVYFCKGWRNARGCIIEHEVAKAYGLEIIYGA